MFLFKQTAFHTYELIPVTCTLLLLLSLTITHVTLRTFACVYSIPFDHNFDESLQLRSK